MRYRPASGNLQIMLDFAQHPDNKKFIVVVGSIVLGIVCLVIPGLLVLLLLLGAPVWAALPAAASVPVAGALFTWLRGRSRNPDQKE